MGMITVKKNFSLLLFVMIILWATNLSAAAAAAYSYTTDHHQTKSFSSCNGTIAECFGKELESVMDSDISRMLLQQQGGKDPATTFTLFKGKTIGGRCNRNKYVNCLPNANKITIRRDCKPYEKCRLHA